MASGRVPKTSMTRSFGMVVPVLRSPSKSRQLHNCEIVQSGKRDSSGWRAKGANSAGLSLTRGIAALDRDRPGCSACERSFQSSYLTAGNAEDQHVVG